jgi:hypothetical protein
MSVHTTSTLPPPTAIGGLGGSGTRVFAALLQAAGLHMGACLNAPLDNLWFTVLFKRPAWARGPAPQTPAPADVATSVRLFHRAMVHGLADWSDPADRALLDGLRASLPPGGSWQCGAQAEHADSLLASLPPPGGAWGWKEPNTHIFLPQLDRHIPGLRYIHVMRDGLDMAFSGNTWQASHWGHLYGCPLQPGTPLPVHQLRFWSAANRRALDYGRMHMPGRFLAVHYEDFCIRPQGHWARILRFLGLPDDRPLPQDLVRPSTIGRSVARDLSAFSPSDLAEARAVQSEVESRGNL